MTRQMNVLLVEDDDVDAMIARRALKKIAPDAVVVHVQDGIEALELLKNDTNQCAIPHPYFILLDINMPRMNGHEFLAELRGLDTGQADTVVYMFTTSDNPSDIERAYSSRANGYILKPCNQDSLRNTLETLQNFWRVCEPPLAPGV